MDSGICAVFLPTGPSPVRGFDVTHFNIRENMLNTNPITAAKPAAESSEYPKDSSSKAGNSEVVVPGTGTLPNPVDFWTFRKEAVNDSPTPSRIEIPAAGAIVASRTRVKLLVVVEGERDVSFLREVSEMLHHSDQNIPDLRSLEQADDIVFIPVCGSNFGDWIDRLRALMIPTFFLMDREFPPLTIEREAVVSAVNRRPECYAQLTLKRAIENYLHADAIREARGIDVDVTDTADVANLVAKKIFETSAPVAWEDIPSRGRRRLRNLAKRWLNSSAIARMTPARLDERDPRGEVRGWLSTIAWAVGYRPSADF
jgi:hypothetical protein